MRVDRINIVGGELGFVNQAAKPEYRLYLADAELTLEHYSNQLRDGPASLAIQGKFMGTGDDTDLTAPCGLRRTRQTLN